MIGVPKPETHKARKERKKALYLAFREVIFYRDNHMCRLCGTNSNVEIHHVHGKSGYRLTDPNNVITICRKCHTAIQYRYDMRDMLKELVRKLNQ